MKKIQKINQKLEKIEAQKRNLNSIENMSLIQFIKFKNLLAKEEKLNYKKKEISYTAAIINHWYTTRTKMWIDDLKINCRKYAKLQKKALYKRDYELYKIGYIDKLPLLPLLNKIKKNLSKIYIPQFNFFRKIPKKLNYFKSYILPQKINTVALNTAKRCIKGYKIIQSNYKFIRSFVNSNNSIKYIKNIISEACYQLNETEDFPVRSMSSQHQKELAFRQSLKYIPRYNDLTVLTNNRGLTNKSYSLSAKKYLSNPSMEL